MRRRDTDRFHRAADKRLHAHWPVADGDRLQQIWIESLRLQHFFGDQLVRALDRSDADALAFQLLHIFDVGTNHHVVRTFFEMNENKLHRKTLEHAAKYAGERRGKGHIAVDHRRRAKPRVHLNDLHLQAFAFEVALLQRHILRHRRAASARVSDPHFLRRLGAENGRRDAEHESDDETSTTEKR